MDGNVIRLTLDYVSDLCCHSIHERDANKAQIILRDKFPTTSSEHPTAVVNIVNILENLNHELLQVGSWVNLMGYVRATPKSAKHDSKSSKDGDDSRSSSRAVHVEATMMWSAGAIKLDKYRTAAREYQSLSPAG